MLSHCMVRMDGFALCTKEFGLISGDRVCDYSFLYCHLYKWTLRGVNRKETRCSTVLS